MSDASDQLVSALAANGFPRMPAAVLMALMTSESDALTAEQLAEELGASPAAISGAVRYLGTVGMVQRHRERGARHYVYALPDHPWYTVSISKNDLYTYIVRLADRAVAELGPRGAERVEEMADFFRFLETRLPQVMEEWAKLRASKPN